MLELKYLIVESCESYESCEYYSITNSGIEWMKANYSQFLKDVEGKNISFGELQSLVSKTLGAKNKTSRTAQSIFSSSQKEINYNKSLPTQKSKDEEIMI
jgi:hypothetical protein